ncbi:MULTISPECIES: filamentous hemagglutinin N-terminal domain-containing protein [unclassified Anabaena]|uniref:filamentous hemagglutinin N-terminal domain-containing protein n=1 Tax=unclassified Anabaena TaxID=2619674 RepID=UPI0039C650A0
MGARKVGILIFTAIIFNSNSTIAEIIPDGTLPQNSQIIIQDDLTTIEGGTRAGMNLFHSFERFSVQNGSTVEFNNSADIQNIISRVTGTSISQIDGILKAHSTANLFLINPNGIVFGTNAALDIGGSFLASTGTSLNFADGTKFTTTEAQTTPLLTITAPIGLQFGSTVASIRNQSQANSPDGTTNIRLEPVGLQVQSGKTLALVGGDIVLEGGSLTAVSGQIELGSVGSNSLVSLNSTNQDWVLGYEGVQNFQNIQLIQHTVGESNIPSTIDTSGKDGGGRIQLQGKTVELIGFVFLISRTTGVVDGRNLTINANKLILRDGAQIDTSTIDNGRGGNLFVNASESVDLIGTSLNQVNILTSATAGGGKAGDININTQRLRVQDGSQISTQSSGTSIPPNDTEFRPATGDGGNLIITASESVEIIGTSENKFGSSLSASTFGPGEAGTVTIKTGKLIIQDGARINVRNRVPRGFIYLGDANDLGKAGDINVTANSILLNNQGTLSSDTRTGQGGDITLQVRDLLQMRRNSQISTNAGTAEAGGDGGNITINAPNGFIVAVPLENSDITANAFSGAGGKISITANSIFGFVQRDRADLERLDPDNLDPKNLPTSDITAISQQNPSLTGTVEINTPEVDPSNGLVELPLNVVDASQQVASGCYASGGQRSSFVVTGRGGIASSPSEILMSDTVLADWIPLEAGSENRTNGMQDLAHIESNSVKPKTRIVEAQGWVRDTNGDVILVAQAPTVMPQVSNRASCAAD